MKRPEWLPPLSARDERLRAAHGLTPKRDGWYKAVDGRTRYICKPCPVPEAAALLPARLDGIRRDDAARTVPVHKAALTLEGLADLYVTWLRQRLETGLPKKLSRRTYDDNLETIARFVAAVGPARLAESVGPDDFSRFARARFTGRAASTVRREVIYIEAFANWAAPGSRKAGHLTRPWQYGPDFRKPSEDEISTSAADSDKAYTPKQLRAAFRAVKGNDFLRAAGWVGLCAAMQPKDVALLPEDAVDLGTGLVTFARGKTGVGRMAWLPPAAVVAVRRYLAGRCETCDPDARGLLFRTETGRPYYRSAKGSAAGTRFDYVGMKWSTLTGLPFSGLRSTAATIADDFEDQRAVDVLLGHKSGSTTRKIRSKHYAKKFSPERARRLVEHVVAQSFGRSLRRQEPGPSGAGRGA